MTVRRTILWYAVVVVVVGGGKSVVGLEFGDFFENVAKLVAESCRIDGVRVNKAARKVSMTKLGANQSLQCCTSLPVETHNLCQL